MYKIKEGSENYACTVVQIKDVYHIEGADKIQRVVVEGNDVVVPKDIKVGDKMLYFVSGTRLNQEYCMKNNLLDKAELNSNKEIKGFISYKQLRVKAIKLKGIVSNGMLIPLKSLEFFVEKELNLGDSFTDIGDFSLCEKYVVSTKVDSNNNNKKTKTIGNRVKELLIDTQFRFHHNTEHFVKNIDKFSQDTEVIITRKLHGSSLILSNVLVNKKLSIKNRIFNFIGANVPKTEYGFIWSSGKPKGKLPKGIVSESNLWETPNPSFYTEDIWEKAYKQLKEKLEKGITLYGEIVGEGIQGKEFTYDQDYGIYIYRITSTNIDGQVYEFSWEMVKSYCEKYGLNYVQEYFKGKVLELVGNNDLLEYLKSTYLDKSYPDCKYDEGICIRIDNTNEILKLKSPNFIKMESDLQEKDVEEKES